MAFFKDFKEDLTEAVSAPMSQITTPDFGNDHTLQYRNDLIQIRSKGLSEDEAIQELAKLRLHEAMRDSNILTGAALVELSGVNRGSISQYLNGLHIPSSINAKKIADVLGVNPLWLMAFDAPKYYSGYAKEGNSEALTEEIVRRFNEASEDTKSAILAILRIK